MHLWYTQSVQELELAIIKNSAGNLKGKREEIEAKEEEKSFHSFIADPNSQLTAYLYPVKRGNPS